MRSGNAVSCHSGLILCTKKERDCFGQLGEKRTWLAFVGCKNRLVIFLKKSWQSRLRLIINLQRLQIPKTLKTRKTIGHFQVQVQVQVQKHSLSKWGQVHNLSCGNEFYFYENENYFHIKGWAPNLDRFDIEARRNSKMGASKVTNFPPRFCVYIEHPYYYSLPLCWSFICTFPGLSKKFAFKRTLEHFLVMLRSLRTNENKVNENRYCRMET